MESGDGGAGRLLIPYYLFSGYIMVFDFCGGQEAMEEIEGMGLVDFVGNKCDGG